MLDVLNQTPWLLAIGLLTLGMVVGSFLNVVIYRLPVMMQSQWQRECCELLSHEDQ